MIDKISAFILGLLCIAVIQGYGQDVIGQPKLEYSSKLPDVAAIQKAIDIPVSPFTGQANVAIPVYTISSRSIIVPISLDYSTGGFKADQTPGVYGLGWTLNAGGSITRQVRGNEDEGLRFETKAHKFVDVHQTPNVTFYKWATNRDSLINLYHWYGGYYINSGDRAEYDDKLYAEFSSHDSAISSGNIAAATATPFFYNGLVDGEPDIFYFKFGNYSGKFVFSQGYGSPAIIVPYNQDLQITPDVKKRLDTLVVNGSTDTTFYAMFYFNSFKISTTDGKDYYFGETDGSKIYTPVIGKPNMYNGWQLTRIIDRNTADTITFDYTGATNTQALQLESKQQFIKNDGGGCLNNPVLQTTSQSNVVGNLATITSSKEQVVFSGSVIEARDRFSGEAFRRFFCNYSRDVSMRRLLKEFSIRDLKLNATSLYSFEYYNTTGYSGTSAQDYWGYYNGINSGGKLYLGYTGCYSDSANRHPAWPAMQLSALTAINFPTGGKTIIEYEPHDANSGRKLDNGIAEGDAYFIPNMNYSLPAMVGGLRVRRVMQYDPVTNDTLTTRYIYKKFGTNISSGHLYDPPSLLIDYSSLPCGTGNLSPSYLRSTQNLFIGSGTGEHVSYSNVTVQEEKNGVNNGYTEYDYYNDTNTDSAFYSNSTSETTRHSLNTQYNLFPGTQFKRLPENFLDGKEKESRVYNRSGTLLQKTSTQYKASYYTFTPATQFTSIYKGDACHFVYHASASGTATDGVKGNWFGIDSAGRLVSESIGPDHGGRRPVLPPPYSYYYMYTYIIEKMAVRPSVVIKTTFESPTKFIIDTISYYYESTAHLNATSVVTRSSKGDVIKQQMIYSFDYNPVNNGDSTIYFMQKGFVNVPIASFRYVNGNIISGGYRSYKYKSRADSASFVVTDENNLLLNPSGILPSTLNISATYPQTFNFPSTYFQKTASFKYNADNTISYAIKKGNEKINLLWDYNKSFVVARTIGADSADLAFTSFETNFNGNWIVAGSSRDTTNFFTGKRAYNLAGGNITKGGLNTGKAYVVSYWSFGAAATVNSTTGVAGLTKNGWHYYEHKLSAGTSSVSIGGSVIIDELRIFPSDAQMTTYSINPMLGVTAADQSDNTLTYYEYDGRGRLRFVRDADKNILKAASYYEPSYQSDTATWRLTGISTPQKCSADTHFYSRISVYQEQDFNPNSLTYGNTRTTYQDSCVDCDISSWTNTANTRCQKDSANVNTGYQMQEQKDINPCSVTANQTRWKEVVNTSSCPVPTACEAEGQRMINGSCVMGTKIITASGYVSSQGKWSYTYHYAWLPNCVTSGDYTAYSSTPVMVGGSCSPL